MKRHLALILIFLLLGAILNIAVAWGCALMIDISKCSGGFDYSENDNGERLWEAHQTWCTGFMEVSLTRGVSFTENTGKKLQNLPDSLPRWSDLHIPFEEDGDREVRRTQRAIIASGWPFLSLWCERDRNVYRIPEGGFMRRIHTGPHGGVDSHLSPRVNRHQRFPSDDTTCARVIPLRPIWISFIFNSLFYAIPLWSLFPGRIILRRHCRIRRGRCGQCGYLVAPNIGVPGASPNCPECGTPIHPCTPPD